MLLESQSMFRGSADKMLEGREWGGKEERRKEEIMNPGSRHLILEADPLAPDA